MAAVTTLADLKTATATLYVDDRFRYDSELLRAWYNVFKAFKPANDEELDGTAEIVIKVMKDLETFRCSAAAAGGRRKTFKKKRLMSKKYCKKTPCRRMGFTQKASCRPYKNCYQ
jgi:hypothetical protein